LDPDGPYPQEIQVNPSSDPESSTIHDYNVKVLDQIGQPGTIVQPLRLENRRRVNLSTRHHKIRHLGTHEHLHHVTLQIVLDGKKYKIKLTRNDELLSSGIVVKHFEKFQGTPQQVLTKTIEHCYYHGEVRKDEWSRVAVSTCNGIRGVIQMHNETYVIQPLIKNDKDPDHPHVIFKASVSPDEQCGNSQGLWSPFQELYQGELTRKTKFSKAQKYMGVQLSHQDAVEYAVDIANIMDMYYRELNFKVALTYLELWSEENRFPVDSQYRALLSRFLHYRNSQLSTDNFDAAFFITGIDLDHKKVGVAIPDSICSDRAVAVIKSDKVFEPQQTATILSHMAGHILGIQHDEDGNCVCNDAFGCIMSTDVLHRQGYHSRMFSTCSHSDLEGGLNTGIASCLWGVPKTNTDFKQTCGNSLIERGEECDCGSPEFLSTDHICRPRHSECDVPEYCDGGSGNCPSNTYIEDGHPCSEGKGYCVGGICPTVQKQCQDIWGQGAKAGHDQCFQSFNPTGNFNGHCGKDKETGNYAKCSYNDIMCGLLHCEGGQPSPLYGSDKGFAKTNINANNNEYECKTVHGPAMMNIPHMGMVKDGTKCGHNKICGDNACVQLPFLHSFTCPTSDSALICSGHGVCAPNRECFCNPGWKGIDCSEVSNETVADAMGASMTNKGFMRPVADVKKSSSFSTAGKETHKDKGSAVLMAGLDSAELPEVNKFGEANTPATAPMREGGDGISTTLLIIILATVVFALVLCLGITLLCYRRRSPSKASQVKEDSKEEKKGGRWNRRKGKKGKKGQSTSEEESELGELAVPPIIVTDPGSAVPGRGILKNSGVRLDSLDKGKDGSKEYMYGEGNDDDDDDDDDDFDDNDDAEIQDIFGDGEDMGGGSAENMSQLQESSSFDFMIPPPPPTLPEPQHYYSTLAEPQPQAPPTWRTPLPPQTLSPPQSRIIKLRNFSDFHQRSNIDLSPSPEDEDHPLVGRCHGQPSSRRGNLASSLHSPSSSQGSSASSGGVGGQACAEPRPSLGSLSQYLLGDPNSQQQHQLQQFQQQHHNNLGRGSPLFNAQEQDMPPPMNPINIRNILGGMHNQSQEHNHNQQHHCFPHQSSTPGSTVSRDSNTSLHMINGSIGCPDSFASATNGGESHYGTGTSGYGSEHDPGEIITMPSLSSRSHSLSRSHSGSPPSYSAVIRTGPNRIQLVPAFGEHDGCRDGEGREIEGIQQELNKLLENLPRIDAGSYVRSPLTQSSVPGTPPTGRSAMSQGSSPGTPLMGLSAMLPQGTSPGTPPMARSTLSQGSFASSSLLSRQANKQDSGDSGAPCIDRSLEEIPAHFSDKKNKSGEQSSKKKRPISVAVQGKQSICDGENHLDDSQPLYIADSMPQKV
ncbi:disintegrin and metalloproteinase domain-containing protein, partial [Elysia marginata]